MDLPDFNEIEGFEWDAGNLEKNRKRHDVRSGEIEELFFNEPLIVKPDDFHSDVETRFMSLGVTNSGRKLFCVFTIRDKRIRPISARDMTSRERKAYDNS
ncbi:MAG: BrnT family toxin [Ignavibacteria bacterium]|nr:BrnT family toxin [Ignavibacteria bacterium]